MDSFSRKKWAFHGTYMLMYFFPLSVNSNEHIQLLKRKKEKEKKKKKKKEHIQTSFFFFFFNLKYLQLTRHKGKLQTQPGKRGWLIVPLPKANSVCRLFQNLEFD